MGVGADTWEGILRGGFGVLHLWGPAATFVGLEVGETCPFLCVENGRGTDNTCLFWIVVVLVS